MMARARQGGPLGCDSAVYRVAVTDRCRDGSHGAVRAEFDRVASLGFNRTLNGISVATIELGPGCCEQVREARQGRDLLVFRNDEEVWKGELMSDPSDCRSGATITAFDPWAPLTRRLVHRDLCFRDKCGGSAALPMTVAKALIDDGIGSDDHCFDVTYLGAPCGPPIEREYLTNSAYTMDALKDLAKAQIDYTAHGGRLIVMCKDYALGRTAPLNCAHFASDVCAGSGGLSTATRVVVVGDGVFGSAGGTDPYYGLLEVKVDDDSIKTVRAANEEARARLRALRPPVWWVDAPNGSNLTKDAPVSLQELVPGVLVPVQLDCTCTPLSEVMRLTDVKVSYDGTSGERVAVTLSSINRIGEDGATVEVDEADEEG